MADAATLHDSRARRLTGIDAARGLALAGMIIVNVGPIQADGPLHRLYLLPYGRASVLFVTIAGIGMGYLLRSRQGERRRWPTVWWRASLLLVGGLALQLLTDDVSVILPIYGVLFVLALALQSASRSVLLGLTLAMTVIGPVLYAGHIMLEDAEHLSGPLELGDPVAALVHGLVLSGRYPLVTWCVPFLFGLWVARLDLRDQVVLGRILIWGAVAAVVGFGLSQVSRSALGPGADSGFGRLLTGTAHGQMPLWLISSVGGAVFVVAALVRLGARWSRITGPFLAAGQLPLTLYVLHVLVLAAIKPSGGYTFAEGVGVSVLLIASLMGFAVLWRRKVGIGPLEWVVRASWWRSPGGASSAPPGLVTSGPEQLSRSHH